MQTTTEQKQEIRYNTIPFLLFFTKPLHVTIIKNKMVTEKEETFTLEKTTFKTWIIFRSVPLILVSLLLFKLVSPFSFIFGFVFASAILALVEYFKQPIIAILICLFASIASLFFINTLPNANYYIREMIQAFAFSIFYASIIRDYLMRDRFNYYQTIEKKGMFVRVKK